MLILVFDYFRGWAYYLPLVYHRLVVATGGNLVCEQWDASNPTEGFAYIRNGFPSSSFFFLLIFVVFFVLTNVGNLELSATFRHGNGYISPW